jgi:hypothetical protein
MANETVIDISGITAPGDSDHRVVVTATFQADADTGGDWGTDYNARLYKTQNASTTYGDYTSIALDRNHYALTYVFDLSSGHAVTCGLQISTGSPYNINFYDVLLKAEVIKR